MTKIRSTEAGHFHAVKFYQTPESLCRMVAEFLSQGLNTNEPLMVIATPEHRVGIVAELHARHFDVHKMQAAGDLLMVDARETLATFMVDGMPDAKRFDSNMTRLIDQVCRGRQGCTIRAYGEMVDVLWKAGQNLAAIRLEMLWNKLAMSHDFSLLCGYAMGNFYKDASLKEISQQHSHVIGEQGSASPTERAVN